MLALSSRRRILADRIITVTTFCAISMFVGRTVDFLFNHLAGLLALSLALCLLAIVAPCLLRLR